MQNIEVRVPSRVNPGLHLSEDGLPGRESSWIPDSASQSFILDPAQSVYLDDISTSWTVGRSGNRCVCVYVD